VVKHAGTGGETTSWNTRDFNIQVSQDGSTWTTVVNVTGNTASTTTHPIAATQARYVRLNVTVPTQTSDSATRIYELEVYA
jgi:NedA-like, galactose-binding domain